MPLAAAPVHSRHNAALGSLSSAEPSPALLPSGAVRTLPVGLIENRGQLAPAVRFYVQASGTAIYFSPGGVTYALTSPDDNADKSRSGKLSAARWAVKVNFLGANPNPVIEGLDRQSGVVSYFTGKRSEWKTGLPVYGSIVYRDLWPGIDLQFDAKVSHVKYKFVVQPGADPSQIRLAYSGAGISIDPLGQLAASTPLGGFHDAAPFSYQDHGGARLPVNSSYRIDSAQEDGGTYGFTLGEYDRNATLVIDPSVIVYAGYIGGVDVDAVHALAVDAAGNAYVAGETASAAGFPTTAGPDTSFNGGSRDAFVAKISADGTTLLYAGFLGGAADDYATGIAIDAAGNAYVTGETRSNQSSFPVVGGPDLSFNGASDAFVAKINAAGTALLYSGYIGGAAIDTANAIAVDSAGNAYIAGDTFSPEATFPVTVGPDLTFNGVRDAFVAKVNALGSALSYAGYIGGAQFDIARAIAVDASGSAYVAGETASNESSFPVSGGPDLTYNGGSRDAFVAQVAPGGAAISYAGYVGGAGDDIAHAIAVNAAGESFVAGETSSTEASFPVLRGPALTYGGGSRDAFAAKVNSGGGSLFYSGFIGGAGTDIARAAALDDAGSLVVSGATASSEVTFPLVIGPGLAFGGVRDAFASKVNPAGTGLLFSGYFGGSGDDAANAVALDAAGNLYLAGSSSSTEGSFPAIAGPDLTANGSSDAFVAKINVGEPHITAEGVVNAASYKVGPIAPGEIISIFGTAIGPDEPLLAQLDSNGRVATTLGSTTVFFGSDPGALFYVSDTQINVQAPYSIAGAPTVDIRIQSDGLETNSITVPVAPSAPGIFTSDASGSGQAAAVDINGNLNTADNAVGPGDIIILFATGEGQTDPAGVTGKLAEQPFPVPVLPVKLLVGGIEAQLLYAGAAPGFAGLLQINAIVPTGITALNAAESGAPPVAQSGNGIPVELIIGDESSQPDVFLNFTGGTGIGVPIADPQSVTTNEDTPRNITLTGGDPAGQPLTFSILSGPAHGSLGAFGATTPTSASLTYTPTLNYNGPDSFQFQVLDPDGNTASAAVSITVLPINDAPIAVDDSRSTDPGDSVVISVLANDSDPDNDPLTVTAVGNPANGTASTNGTTVTYTPNSGFTGTDTFSYTISDGALTDSASISVRVRGSSNEGPSAAPQSLMTEQGVPILITLTGSDPDGDDLTFGIQSGPSNGTLSAITQLTNETATVTYTPNPTFIGIDQFVYVVTDEHGASSPGIITIQVKGVTDMAITKTDMPDPVLSGSMLTYNIAIANLGPNDAPNVVVTDPLPGVVTFVSATPSQGGCVGGAVVTCNLGTIPNGGGATIAIVVTVNTGLRTGIIDNTASVASDLGDLNLANNSATASTMVINEPPVIGNPTAAAQTVGNTQLNAAQVQAPQTIPEVFFQTDLMTLGNVTDINGDPLTFSVASPLTTNGGGVTITNPATGEFLYTPPVGNNSPDSFTYQVADPGNPPVMGTVNITFTGRIWYVKNDHPGMSSGTSVSPFSTLADAEGASAAGDDIFVHFGDGTTTGQDAGVTLKNNQRLIGEGVALDIDLALNGGTAPTPLFTAGTKPMIENTNVDSGVSVADVTNIVIRGLNIRGLFAGVGVGCSSSDITILIGDNAIRPTSTYGIEIFAGACKINTTIENNTIAATFNGVHATAVSAGALEFAINNNTEINAETGAGIAIGGSTFAPKIIRSFVGNTISGLSGGDGILIENATFDADPSTPNTFETVSGGTTVIGDITTPDPVGGAGMRLNHVSGDLQFTDLDIAADSGFGGVQITGTSTFAPGPPDSGFRLTIAAGTIHATGGPSLAFEPLAANITLDQITSANSSGMGVSLTDLTGTITINNGGSGSSISGSSGSAFSIGGGNAAVTYDGSVNAGTGLAVSILGRTGGAVTFGGAIASDAPGGGISIANSATANTVTFNGAVNLGQTTPLTSAGVDIENNVAGAEIHFNAPLQIATNGAFGVVATNPGLLTTAGGSIDTTNSRAITTSGIGFGPSSLNFDTITVNNPASAESGIVLEDFTGTANLGVVTLNTTTGTALFLANGGTVTTLPGSTITTTDAQAINASAVDFGFGSLHLDSITATYNASSPVSFGNTRGRANLMGGTIATTAPIAMEIGLFDASVFELILSGTTLDGGTLDFRAQSLGTGSLCLSAAGNSMPVTTLAQGGAGALNVVQQDQATFNALNGVTTPTLNGTVNFGQGCLSAPVPGDPFGTPPTAVDDSGGAILEGGMVDIPVTANDSDPDPGDAVFLNAIVTAPTLGTATILNTGTVRYTQNVTIGADSMDSFAYQIVDKSGNTATATVSVNITNVNDPPVIANATIGYDALGNTALEVLEGGTQSPPSLFLDQTADSLIGKANISDTDGPGPLTCTLTGTPPLGTVTFLPNSCDFTYVPPAGNRGDGTAAADDSFQYEVSDNSAPTPGTATGTVEINIAGLVWYVKNDAGAPNTGTGTSADPFTTLADVDGTSDGPGGAGPSEVGDIIYVFRGDGTDTNQDAGISLRDQQKLRGSGAPLVATGTFNGVTDPILLPVDPSGPPLISNAAGTAVLVATAADGDNSKTSIEVAGIHASGVHGIHVACTTVANTSTTVTGNMLTGSGAGNGLRLDAAAGCLTNTIAVDGNVAEAGTGAAILLSGVGSTGTWVSSFNGNSVTPASGGPGIIVLGATFDSAPGGIFQPVNGGATIIGASGDPVGAEGFILGTSAAGEPVSGELVFTDLDIFATNTALDVAGSGVLAPASPNATAGFGLTTPAGSTLSSTTAPALLMDPLTANTVFDTANGTVVSLTDVAGVVNIVGGALTGSAAAPAFQIGGGNAAVTYGGSAAAGSGQRVVDILNRTGGSATFNGAITSDSPGLGISITGATATSNTTFTGNVDLGLTTALGSAGVNVNHNSTASATAFANLDIVTSGADGLTAMSGGTLNVTTGTVSATNGTALNIANTGTTSFTLASLTQTGTAPSNGINIVNSTGTKNFSAVNIANSNNIAIGISNGGAVNIDDGSPTSTINATGPAFVTDSTALGVNFLSTSSNSATPNIVLNGNSGSAHFGTGALSGSGGAFGVNGGNAVISYAGSLTNTGSGDVVNIINTTGGSVALSGNISDTAGGTGITVLNANTTAPTTITFSGATKTINTAADIAVNLDNNDLSTINFTNGGLAITTTTAAGFNAVNGAAAINVTGANNTVASTTGTAVNIANSTIGASGITFRSVASNGGANPGIVLNTTGSAGGLTVTGDNATGMGTGANNDSGGSILNKTGDGIALTSTSNVSLDQMRIQDAADDGIDATSVNGMTLTRMNIVSNGSANEEHGVKLTNATGTVTVANTLADGNFDAHFRVFNDTANITLFSVNDSVLQNVTTGSFEDGIIFELATGRTGAISVTNSTFINHDGDHVQAACNGSANMTATITGNTMTGAAGNLGAGITVNCAGTFSGTTNFTISNNNIQKANDNSTSINVNLGSSTAAGTFSGTIAGNTIGTLGMADSAGDTGIAVEVNQAGTMTVLINNNTIREFDQFGIDIGAVDGTGVLNATLTGNTATSADANVFAAVFGDAQTNNVICADIGDDSGSTPADQNTLTASAGFTEVAFQTGGSGIINLESYAGAASNQAQIQTYIQGRNSGTPGVQLNVGGGPVQGGGACPVPAP